MWDTIQKLEYRARANLTQAKAELNDRLTDRLELPLPGLYGEKLYLTGVSKLQQKATELDQMYRQLPSSGGMTDILVLDAWASATIEGARTTVQQVRQSFTQPKTKDDRMVINTVKASNYAYRNPITPKNIRRLWESIVDGVCENEDLKGTLYRSGAVEVASQERTIHEPAHFEKVPELMDCWFVFRDSVAEHMLIHSFICHFYFVYVHPFCDGNGRAARILNASQLYHAGYSKMKRLPLSSSINSHLNGYYRSLTDSEIRITGTEGYWLDLSPFVSYMLDVFEDCLINAALSKNELTENETKLLQRMNKVGINAEITVKKAKGILNCSESSARRVLMNLVDKGYLAVDSSQRTYVYRLQQHIPNI
ncbi:MAG: Fic family protein [Oscillospiraceae bacterium]|nr:Fic family protein [Oscillospiraceae bacterium]